MAESSAADTESNSNKESVATKTARRAEKLRNNKMTKRKFRGKTIERQPDLLYKQSGVKSKKLKLLRHPIENLERKLLVSYFLGMALKLVAILTGPLLIGCLLLIVSPFWLCRRLMWLLASLKLNSSFSMLNYKSTEPEWLLKPLTFIESYWMKRNLVTNVLLVIDTSQNNRLIQNETQNSCTVGTKSGDNQAQVVGASSCSSFDINKLRNLVLSKILELEENRKFCCKLISFGLPFYKSYYWSYCGHFKQPNFGSQPIGKDEPPTVDLSAHIYEDSSIADSTNKPDVAQEPSARGSSTKSKSKSTSERSLFGQVRDHLHWLSSQPLDIERRPGWEVRVLSRLSSRRTFLVIRCHQSLADGRTLSQMLTSQLLADQTKKAADSTQAHPQFEAPTSISISTSGGQQQHEAAMEQDELELRLLSGQKGSFVAMMSRASCIRSVIFVAPITVLLWLVWSFRRRNKHNHLSSCKQTSSGEPRPPEVDGNELNNNNKGLGQFEQTATKASRFHMSRYDLTKFHQIKQMTRSSASDLIVSSLAGALRDFLRHYNGISNPPNLHASLVIDSRSSTSQVDLNANIEPQALADGQPPNRNSEPQVKITLVSVPLPVATEGSIPRLWDVRATLDELRHSADPWVMLGLQFILFHLLPVGWYQSCVNWLTMDNSSAYVSNFRGPNNMIEFWCVDLFQQVLLEARKSQAQASPFELEPESQAEVEAESQVTNYANESSITSQPNKEQTNRSTTNKSRSTTTCANRNPELNRLSRLALPEALGQIEAIYYHCEPPTSDIPISVNCITYHNKLYVTVLSRSILVDDSRHLIRLFFGHLDQLANTIGRRRSVVPILQLPSPVQSNSTSGDVKIKAKGWAGFSAVAGVAGSPKRLLSSDDSSIRDERLCASCSRPADNCTCHRRKSLFSDASSWLPSQLVSIANRYLDTNSGLDASANAKGFDLERGAGQSSPGSIRRLIRAEQADQSRTSGDIISSELAGKLQSQDGFVLRPKLDSVDEIPDSVGGDKSRKLLSPRLCNEKRHSTFHSRSDSNLDESKAPKLVISSSKSGDPMTMTMSSSQPRTTRVVSSFLSNSSRTVTKTQPQPELKTSWISSHSVDLDQRQPSSSNFSTSTHNSGHKRRKSLAVFSGFSHLSGDRSPRAVILRDEINANVSLRYQPKFSLVARKSRRSSSTGLAVDGERLRTSLIPFGLLHHHHGQDYTIAASAASKNGETNL